jgi:hypothetical protein
MSLLPDGCTPAIPSVRLADEDPQCMGGRHLRGEYDLAEIGGEQLEDLRRQARGRCA